ncbi:unnamed protein product [Rangifer tarandus platyrhynchus]|uniref:Uncharacterized protein n=1 Tax=Rangifer tarandus platyrhynchus TaxID=3082113 RepID=A0ABN8ZJN6_RANTA|nr:unnamed protein product [Rangifer tarandus platyrhynchus]
MAVLGIPSPTPPLPSPHTNPAALGEAPHRPHSGSEKGGAPSLPWHGGVPQRPLWAPESSRWRSELDIRAQDPTHRPGSVQRLLVAKGLPALALQGLLPRVLEYVAAFWPGGDQARGGVCEDFARAVPPASVSPPAVSGGISAF